MNFTLTSTKGTRSFVGTLAEAMQAAIAMDNELQPAYGVTLTEDGADVNFECRDGQIAVDRLDGTDEGIVHEGIPRGEMVVVSWASGVSTPTPASLLRPA